jgi:hypothetical protein
VAIVSARIQAEDSTISRRGVARPLRRQKVTLNHPIFTRWPAQYPDRLQLFSLPTPNGVKVGIMLEETGLAYEPHRIDIMADESHDPAFLALNPNSKIPAIYDPGGPSGAPLALFESGAILLYLADKTRQFISADPNTRYETIQWVMWQMGGVGPMFGQVGFFNKFAGKAYEDKRPRDRISVAARCPRRTARGPRVGDGRRLQHRRHLAARLGRVRSREGFSRRPAGRLDLNSIRSHRPSSDANVTPKPGDTQERALERRPGFAYEPTIGVKTEQYFKG